MNINQEILKQVSESYRKIRNTFRFIHGNISDFNLQENGIEIEKMSVLNRYVLNEVIKVNRDAKKDYENYNYQAVTTNVLTSLTNLMSSYYLDYTKDILYIVDKDDQTRREIQTVLYHALKVYSRLLAPILVHTTEELSSVFEPELESIHLTEFSDLTESVLSDSESDMMASLFSLREAVFKALEMKRESKEIGKSLQAHVLLHLNEEMKKTVSKVCPDSLAQWLIVSKVTLVDETLPVVLDFEIDVKEAVGETCPRCWNIVDSADENGLCVRCHEVMTQE